MSSQTTFIKDLFKNKNNNDYVVEIYKFAKYTTTSIKSPFMKQLKLSYSQFDYDILCFYIKGIIPSFETIKYMLSKILNDGENNKWVIRMLSQSHQLRNDDIRLIFYKFFKESTIDKYTTMYTYLKTDKNIMPKIEANSMYINAEIKRIDNSTKEHVRGIYPKLVRSKKTIKINNPDEFIIN